MRSFIHIFSCTVMSHGASTITERKNRDSGREQKEKGEEKKVQRDERDGKRQERERQRESRGTATSGRHGNQPCVTMTTARRATQQVNKVALDDEGRGR